MKSFLEIIPWRLWNQPLTVYQSIRVDTCRGARRLAHTPTANSVTSGQVSTQATSPFWDLPSKRYWHAPATRFVEDKAVKRPITLAESHSVQSICSLICKILRQISFLLKCNLHAHINNISRVVEKKDTGNLLDWHKFNMAARRIQKTLKVPYPFLYLLELVDFIVYTYIFGVQKHDSE